MDAILSIEDAWADLLEKDDRTSPADHPDMCLITREELASYMLAASPSVRPFDSVAWACARWLIEVSGRPLQNVHRRTLDDTWRQVIRRFGGDPDELIGSSHDELLMAADAKTEQAP